MKITNSIIKVIKLAFLVGIIYLSACVYVGVKNGFNSISEFFKMPQGLWEALNKPIGGKSVTIKEENPTTISTKEEPIYGTAQPLGTSDKFADQRRETMAREKKSTQMPKPMQVINNIHHNNGSSDYTYLIGIVIVVILILYFWPKKELNKIHKHAGGKMMANALLTPELNIGYDSNSEGEEDINFNSDEEESDEDQGAPKINYSEIHLPIYDCGNIPSLQQDYQNCISRNLLVNRENKLSTLFNKEKPMYGQVSDVTVPPELIGLKSGNSIATGLLAQAHNARKKIILDRLTDKIKQHDLCLKKKADTPKNKAKKDAEDKRKIKLKKDRQKAAKDKLDKVGNIQKANEAKQKIETEQSKAKQDERQQKAAQNRGEIRKKGFKRKYGKHEKPYHTDPSTYDKRKKDVQRRKNKNKDSNNIYNDTLNETKHPNKQQGVKGQKKKGNGTVGDNLVPAKDGDTVVHGAGNEKVQESPINHLINALTATGVTEAMKTVSSFKEVTKIVPKEFTEQVWETRKEWVPTIKKNATFGSTCGAFVGYTADALVIPGAITRLCGVCPNKRKFKWIFGVGDWQHAATRDLGERVKGGFYRTSQVQIPKTITKDIVVTYFVKTAAQETTQTYVRAACSSVASSLGMDIVTDIASCAYYDEYTNDAQCETSGISKKNKNRKLTYIEKLGKRAKRYDSKLIKAIASSLAAIGAGAGYKKMNPNSENWKSWAAAGLIKFAASTAASKVAGDTYESIKGYIDSYLWTKQQVKQVDNTINKVRDNINNTLNNK